MISLKKFLARGEEEADSHLRLVWLILEAVACHAIEIDPEERQAFQVSLRNLVTRMEQSTTSTASMVLTGEAIKSIETYNRGVQRAIGSQIRELQAIVSLFTRSMLQVSKGSAASADKLHNLERQMEKSSQTEDLRAIKVQMEQSLGVICEEAATQERRSEQISDQLHEAMSRPESAAALTEAVGDLDLVTGLPNFREAEKAIRSAIGAGTSTYAVLLCVDRVEVINSRFGFSVGDRILMLFGQHLAQTDVENRPPVSLAGARFPGAARSTRVRRFRCARKLPASSPRAWNRRSNWAADRYCCRSRRPGC